MQNIWKVKPIPKHTHKICAELLYTLYEKALTQANFSFSQELKTYEKKVQELKLPPLKINTLSSKELSLKEISTRYHLHLKLSETGVKENKLLPSSFQSKTIKPFGKGAIYLGLNLGNPRYFNAEMKEIAFEKKSCLYVNHVLSLMLTNLLFFL